MPVVKKRRRAGVSQSVPQAQLTNPAFAGQEFVAAQRLGRTIRREGQEIEKIYEQARKSDARSELLKRRNGKEGIIESFNQAKQGFQKDEISSYTENVKGWLDERFNQELEGVKNPYLKTALEEEKMRFSTIEIENAMAFQNSQTFKIAQERVKEAHEGFYNEMLATGDKNLLQQRLSEGLGALQKEVGNLYSPEQAEQLSNNFKKNMSKAWLRGTALNNNFFEARQFVEENGDNLFGSEDEKKLYLQEIDRQEDEYKEKLYRKEIADERLKARRLKAIRDRKLREISVLDFDNPKNVDYFEDEIDKMIRSGVMSGFDGIRYKNIIQREVDRDIESAVLDAHIETMNSEDPEDKNIPLLMYNKGKGRMSAKAKKTVYNLITKSGNLSVADKEREKAFIKEAKGDSGFGASNLDAVTHYQEFRKYYNVEDAILMAKKKGGMNIGGEAKWQRYIEKYPDIIEDESEKEFNEKNIVNFKQKLAVQMVEESDPEEKEKIKKVLQGRMYDGKVVGGFPQLEQDLIMDQRAQELLEEHNRRFGGE
jgi:hypothetical protein